MKKFKYYILPLSLLMLFVLISCNDTYEFHEKYTRDGEIVYATKVDSLKSLSGNGRIKIAGYLTKGFTIDEVTVFWNKGENSQTFAYTKSENNTDPIELIIIDLEEKSYEFEVHSKDVDGNESVKTTVFGTVYGEAFRSNLDARGLNAATYDGTDAEINFGSSGDEFQRDTEIKYTNNNDEEVIVTIGVDETMIVLANASMSTPVMYRTYYVPTLADEAGNETSIDLFPSDWKSLELVLSGSINFGKSDWVITDYSSQHDPRPATNIIDGDLSTFWHSDWAVLAPPYPHYITVDMGVEKTVAGFELFRRPNNNMGHTKHQFFVSTDNVNWTDLGEFIMNPNTNDGQLSEIPSHPTARYFKYVAIEGPGNVDHLAEINMIEIIDNVSWVITDYSSQHDPRPATNIIDGDISTFWHSDWAVLAPPYPHDITVDMGVEKTITGFELFRRPNNNTGHTKHQFFVSTDNVNWTDLGEFIMDPNTNDGQLNEIVSRPTARYFKYVAIEGPSNVDHLAEIKVYGI